MDTFLFWLLLLPVGTITTAYALQLIGHYANNTTLEFYGRSLSSFFALFLCAIYGTVASACLNVAGYGGLGQWTTARCFKWTMLALAGVWFEIEDPNDYLGKTRPAVFVGNHQTELDVLLLGHMFPKYCSVTAKRSLKYVPVLGWFMALSKTVFIERSSRTQAFAAFDTAAQQMHTNRQSVYIFPEGTRSYYDHIGLLPFKKGAFHLAVQAQVPIVPVVVANYSNVLNVKKRLFRAGWIPCKVLKPIETKGKTKDDVQALADEVREKMLEALTEITTWPRHEQIQAWAKEHGVAPRTGAQANGPAKSTGVATS